MNLSVGIVGLPNVGKSTLFNALVKRQQAMVANYPFCTIEPNVGIVPVADERIDKLTEMSHSAQKIYATVSFVDIAGLVKGASQGAGLGNQFLSHIRETDLVLYLLRDFNDENVIREGSVAPKDDLETLKTELILKDLETLNKIKDQKPASPIEKLNASLNKGILASEAGLTEEEIAVAKELCLLTLKPYIVVYNVSENEIAEKLKNKEALVICAKMEAELATLSETEQKEYLQSLELTESGLERVVRLAYKKLGLISYLTTGEKETRAWTIHRGDTAPQAAGVIHTDFEKGFIKAEIVKYGDLITCGGWKQAREAGKARMEGKEYLMQDGDVVEFHFNK